MQENEIAQKRRLQEEEYRFPYHWMIKGSAVPVYESRHRLLLSMIRKLPGPKQRALDLGCGDGRNTHDLQRDLGNGIAFSGIDFSENAIGFAKLIVPHIDFIVQDAAGIGFPSEHFDLVVSIEVIEHIQPDEIPQFLAEIRRVLRPGGGLVLTTPTINQRLHDKHYQHFTEEKLRQLLSAAGFSVVEVKGFGKALSPSINKLYKKILSLPGCWRLAKGVGGKVLDWKKANTIAVSAVKL
jgi:ubiquinone/menaquinone biosynthesis C-methylase UbiE